MKANNLVSVEVESIARAIAAFKMGLMKDKEGKKLPYNLWKQCIPEADIALRALESLRNA